jgi:hypothetical protein
MEKSPEEMSDEEFDRSLQERLAEADAFWKRVQETYDKIDALLAKYEPKEKLAAFAHERWTGWMRYLFSKTMTDTEPLDGSRPEVIPYRFVQRWGRQMETPFTELPEDEKRSDYLEAELWLRMVDESRVASSTRRLSEHLKSEWSHLIPKDMLDEHPVDQAIAILTRVRRPIARDVMLQRFQDFIDVLQDVMGDEFMRGLNMMTSNIGGMFCDTVETFWEIVLKMRLDHEIGETDTSAFRAKLEEVRNLRIDETTDSRPPPCCAVPDYDDDLN